MSRRRGGGGLSRFVDHLTNHQLRATVQLEYLEADDADRDAKAAEKLVHALQPGVDPGTDEQHGNLAPLLFACQLPLHARRQPFGVAEFAEARFKLPVEFIGAEARD